MNREDYIFGSTRVRIFEQGLLTSEEMLGIIDKDDLDEAILELKDTNYGEFFYSKDSNYEDALHRAILALYKGVEGLLDDDLILDITSLKYLYHNLKVITKARLFNLKMEDLLIDVGAFDSSLLFSKAEDKKVDDDYALAIEAIERALEDYEKYQDPQRIDLIYDRYYFKNLLILSEKLGAGILIDYVKEYIDLSNIDILFRSKRRGENRDIYEFALIEGGNIDKSFFIKKYDLDFDEIKDSSHIKGSRYERIFESLSKKNDTGILEEVKEEMTEGLLLDAQRLSFGPEVIISYILKKEREISNLRIILVAKANNISNEKVKERIKIYG